MELICGCGQIVHFLTDQFTPTPPERVIINSGFLIGFGDDTQSGEKRSSLLWIFLGEKKKILGELKKKQFRVMTNPQRNKDKNVTKGLIRLIIDFFFSEFE